MTEDPIELHGTLERSDVLRAVYFCQLRRTWLVPLFLLAPFLMAAAAIAAKSLLPESSDYEISVRPGAIRNTSPFIVILIFWCAFNVLVPLWRVGKLFATVNYLSEPSTLAFTAAGVRSSSVRVSSEFQWSIVTEVCETRALFLMFIGEVSIIVPKRFFQSPDERSAWRAMVELEIAPRKIVRPGLIARHC